MVTFVNTSNTISLPDAATQRHRPDPRPLRGTVRLLNALGHGVLTEFTLKSGRRADILSIGPCGEIWIVEVKSSIEDFRSDHKWRDYLEWCDSFLFSVGPDFPSGILPAEAGLVIADEYDGLMVRSPGVSPLTGARRKALTLRFALMAARRLSGQAAIFE